MSHNFHIFGDQSIEVPAHLHFGRYLLDRLSKQDGNRIAMVNGETKEMITYKEYAQYAVNLASAFIRLGIGKGDVVALGCEKRIEIGPILLGILLTGATYTTYEKLTGKCVLLHKLSVARPNHLIVSKIFKKNYVDIILLSKSLKSVIMLDDESDSSILSLMKQKAELEVIHSNEVKGQTDVALILYSSGTTGMPKGVRLTHSNCILNSIPYDMDYNIIKNVYIGGEWYHNYDTFSIYKFLSVGCTIVYLTQPSPEKILQIVESHEINILMTVPHRIISICKVIDANMNFNQQSLKIIYSRSTRLHSQTIINVRKKFPELKQIIQGYGMTECGELSSENRGTKGAKPGSVGMVSPGVILKISDINSGKSLGPNEIGEIRAKGPVLMKEYIDMDPATYLDGEGFLKTGDLGYYDDDKYFYIVDRIKDVLNYHGNKVSPLELETILEQHPDVLEAGVAGMYDEVDGDIPTAFVALRPDAKVTEQELVDYVANRVSPYMQIRGGVNLLSKLPRNARGKLLRKELKNILNSKL